MHARRTSGEDDEQRLLQFAKNVHFDAQRVDQHVVIRSKFEKVEASKRRRVVILATTGELEVDALNLVREARDVVLSQRSLCAV